MGSTLCLVYSFTLLDQHKKPRLRENRSRMPTQGTHGATSTRKWLLSSPPIEWGLSFLQSVFINSVKKGPVPQHVAFVMDGNRRYARQSHMETTEGHSLGFETLAKVSTYKMLVLLQTVQWIFTDPEADFLVIPETDIGNML